MANITNQQILENLISSIHEKWSPYSLLSKLHRDKVVSNQERVTIIRMTYGPLDEDNYTGESLIENLGRREFRKRLLELPGNIQADFITAYSRFIHFPVLSLEEMLECVPKERLEALLDLCEKINLILQVRLATDTLFQLGHISIEQVVTIRQMCRIESLEEDKVVGIELMKTLCIRHHVANELFNPQEQ